jgi:hypothetical protein
MAKEQKHTIQLIPFSDFIEKFPEVELPVSLTDETLQEFSRSNDPLPAAMVYKFLEKEEPEDNLELIEHIACFRLPQTLDFHAVIYWKADLLNYEYILATFDLKGRPIDKKVIAGTKIENDLLVRSVATIDADWNIYVVGGIADKENSNNYDASSSQSLRIQLLTSGEIIPISKEGLYE